MRVVWTLTCGCCYLSFSLFFCMPCGSFFTVKEMKRRLIFFDAWDDRGGLIERNVDGHRQANKAPKRPISPAYPSTCGSASSFYIQTCRQGCHRLTNYPQNKKHTLQPKRPNEHFANNKPKERSRRRVKVTAVRAAPLPLRSPLLRHSVTFSIVSSFASVRHSERLH